MSIVPVRDLVAAEIERHEYDVKLPEIYPACRCGWVGERFAETLDHSLHVADVVLAVLADEADATCLFGDGGYCVRHGEFCQGKRTTDEEREADRAAGKHYPHDDKGRPQ